MLSTVAMRTLAVLVVTSCAHAPPSAREGRVARYRARVQAMAACALDAPAMTVAEVRAKRWAIDEQVVTAGRLSIDEEASCTKKRCAGGCGCNTCRFSPDATWTLTDANGNAIKLRGWSFADGKSDCEEAAENAAFAETIVVVTARIAEDGIVPDPAQTDVPYEALPVTESICRG